MRTKQIVGWALKSIGVILFVWILSNLDRAAIIDAWSRANPLWLFVAFLLFFPNYYLRAKRWHALMKASGLHVSFKESFDSTMASLFLGIVTPGRAGEAIRIPIVKAAGGDTRTGVALTILDRLWDVAFIGALSIPAFFVLFRWNSQFWFIIGVVVLLFIGIFPWIRSMGELLKREKDVMRKSSRKVALFTLGIWILYYAQLLFLGAAFNFPFPPIWFLSIMTFAGIVSVLPIAPAGLGTREAVLLYFFAQIAIDPSEIVAFSLSIFILTLLASSVGMWHWTRLKLH